MTVLEAWRYNYENYYNGSRALALNEPEGLFIDATVENGDVTVKAGGVMDNVLHDVILDASNLVQSGTSPKMVHFPTSPYVRWTPHNYKRASQTIASWSNNSEVTTISTTDTAPDGTSTAATFSDTTVNTGHKFYDTGISGGFVIGPQYTASIFAKAGTHTWIQMSQFTSGPPFAVWANFNIQAGTVGTSTNTTGVIEDAGNGWYRCSINYISDQTDENTQIFTCPSDGGLAPTYAGTETTFSLWGAQINRGPIATPYLATTSAARIGNPQGYDAAVEGFGLVPEGASTNLALWSDDFTNAAWSKSNMTVAKTATDPMGAANGASILTATAGNATALQAITSGGAFRISSMYVKRRTGSGTIQITSSNGATWTAVTVTSEWTRVSDITVWGFGTDPTVGIRIVTSGDEIDVWGFNHCVSPSEGVTSPIPTLGSTVTRAQDNVSIALTTIPFGAEVSTYLESSSHFNPGVGQTLLHYDDGTNSVRMYHIKDSTDHPIWASSTNASISLDPLTLSINRVAMRAVEDDFALSNNGDDFDTDVVTDALPAVTHLRLGRLAFGNDACGAFLRKILVVPRAMDDTELQSRTVPD